jgi:hypothetical protein
MFERKELSLSYNAFNERIKIKRVEDNKVVGFIGKWKFRIYNINDFIILTNTSNIEKLVKDEIFNAKVFLDIEVDKENSTLFIYPHNLKIEMIGCFDSLEDVKILIPSTFTYTIGKGRRIIETIKLFKIYHKYGEYYPDRLIYGNRIDILSIKKNLYLKQIPVLQELKGEFYDLLRELYITLPVKYQKLYKITSKKFKNITKEDSKKIMIKFEEIINKLRKKYRFILTYTQQHNFIELTQAINYLDFNHSKLYNNLIIAHQRLIRENLFYILEDINKNCIDIFQIEPVNFETEINYTITKDTLKESLFYLQEPAYLKLPIPYKNLSNIIDNINNNIENENNRNQDIDILNDREIFEMIMRRYNVGE